MIDLRDGSFLLARMSESALQPGSGWLGGRSPGEEMTTHSDRHGHGILVGGPLGKRKKLDMTEHILLLKI